MEYSWNFVCSSHLPPEAQESLLRKLEGISCWGHFADWGYAIPFYADNVTEHTLRDDSTDTKITTPEPDTQLLDVILCQSAGLETVSSPLTSLSSPKTHTSPIADDSDENVVPVRRLGNSSEKPYYVQISSLRNTHNITLSMGGDPLMNPYWPSIDTNLLYHTVSSL